MEATEGTYPRSIQVNKDNVSALDILKKHFKTVQKELNHIATNVYLGLGVFMEKPVLPYAIPGSLSFNHLVTLNKNTDTIESLIKPRWLPGNNDDPEAALDGLLQAMVCKKEVGWRELARRIIVLCTDSTYHSAGDGRMLGIFTPSDDQCRLEDNSYAKAATKYDYPSVGLIKEVARKENVQILFVAPKTLRRDYQVLSNQIPGSVYVPLEGNFMSNISYQYEKSLRHPQLVVKKPSHIEVTISPACEREATKECEVDLDKSKTVQVKLELTSCPEKVNEQTVEIGLLGLDNKLTIDVQPQCSCECENQGVQKDTVKCNGRGTLECGLCKSCDTNWGGAFCDCSTIEAISSDVEKCRFNNETEFCSGRGDCSSCGKCEKCVKSSGDYCQFDDEACRMFEGKLCAGHGKCSLGRCNCDSGWTGEDCSCPLSIDSCIPPYYPRKECLGNGHCKCGSCKCKTPLNDNDISYYGQFCQSSETRCNELSDVVICHYTKAAENCTEKLLFSNVDIQKMNRTEFDHLDQTTYTLCTAPMGTGGLIKYKYQDFQFTLSDKMNVMIQNELDFPGLPAKVWVAIGSTIGIVLLIGLLTLVAWKILIDRRDAREYAAFEKNIREEESVHGTNAIYQSATSSFSNPTFNRRSYTLR